MSEIPDSLHIQVRILNYKHLKMLLVCVGCIFYLRTLREIVKTIRNVYTCI
jgi:hypothetical protein